MEVESTEFQELKIHWLCKVRERGMQRWFCVLGVESMVDDHAVLWDKMYIRRSKRQTVVSFNHVGLELTVMFCV